MPCALFSHCLVKHEINDADTADSAVSSVQLQYLTKGQ
jgi:hypothetical protein